MRAFIEANFKMMDVNSDGVIGLEEFRYNCIQRIATDDIKVVDDAFNSLLNVSYLKAKNFSFPCLHDNSNFFPSLKYQLEKFSFFFFFYLRCAILSWKIAENLILKF
jgi:hypothetical protein